MRAYFDGKDKEVPQEWAELFLNVENTAVITIGFSKTHLYFPDNTYFPDDKAVVSGVNEFLQRARSWNIPVIHTMMSSECPEGYIGKYPMAFQYVWPVSLGKQEFLIPEGADKEFSIEIENGDFVITGQKRLSIFNGTNLEILLRNLGIARVVLVGSMTDCCVMLAAFEASDRDFRVVVIEDLCAGTKHRQDAAFKIMSLHCALVMDCDELVQGWEWQKK